MPRDLRVVPSFRRGSGAEHRSIIPFATDISKEFPQSFLFDRFHFFKYSVHFDHSRARCDECHMFRQPGSYACQDDSDDTTVDMTDETMLYQAPFFLNILDCPLM